ncbi:MAG: TatD family deoxyribonuclease [Armatimonadetes bacterium]|nr:MAG: TatD family deoxyribonuclease [Armatimonadota bacterium]
MTNPAENTFESTDRPNVDTVWVDTHAHLFLIDDPVDEVLARASDQGVKWLVCPGVDEATSLASEQFARDHPGVVRWSAGLHPHDASSWPDQADRIADLASRADAVGECGLDFYRNLSSRQAQMAAFADQLALAADLKKPIIIHCRDAFSEVHDMLESAQLGETAVLHCWTGGPRWTKRFDALGVTFSFAGPITYATGDTLRLGAALAPPERTMIETDSPYLTPEPLRGTNNEPAHVHLTGARLAQVWGTTVEQVSQLTTATAERVFADA